MATTATKRRSKKTTTDAQPYIPEAWDRLPDENAKEFDAFVQYRDLAPHERSIRRAAARSIGYQDPKDLVGEPLAKRRQFDAARVRFERASASHYWQARAVQYDEHRDKIRRAAEALAIEEMGRRHAEAGMKLVAKGLEALESVEPKDLPFSELMRYIAEGARLERLARGEAETTGSFDVNPPQDDVRALLSSDPNVAKAGAMLTAAVARARREKS